MATCPECHVRFDDAVESCPDHGSALVPDELIVAEEPPLSEGTMVGEYRVQHKLGAGTFGDVYAGEQPVIGKRVAIKVLNRRFASDPVMVSRFVAEARAVNKIRQRNIIDIFSFGTLPATGRHYFVMELLDGMTLGALLDRTGPLPVALTLPLVRGIADALDAVHEAGITHRDLKPDNVFLARERDGSYFPKLLDFGIAKLLGEDVAHKTGSGMVLGTPRYMSPEQARGKKADHRADVYALGVMIHEMLTGKPLFEGDSAVDMLLKQAVEDPAPMSEIRGDLPPELDAPVLAMLRKRPDDRPPSAGKAVAGFIACATRLGLDKSSITLAQLAADGTPTQSVVPAFRSGADAAPKFAGTTITVDRTPRRGSAAGAPRSPHEQRPVTRDPGADPTGRTEQAPSSPPEVMATLRSRPVAQSATPVSSEPVGSRGPTTESVSAVETSSAIRRLTRARRVQAVGGAAVAGALVLAVWAFAQRGPSAPPPPVANGSADTAKATAEAPKPAATTLPTPVPTVAAAEPPSKPADPTVDAGAAARPAPSLHPAQTMPAGRPTKPASSARNLDRLLGDR